MEITHHVPMCFTATNDIEQMITISLIPCKVIQLVKHLTQGQHAKFIMNNYTI